MKSQTTLLRFLAQKWSLTKLVAIEHSGVNLVFTARKNRTPVILKIIPDAHAFTAELHALEYYKKHGVVPLLRKDSKHQALLLEYIQPGISLKTLFPRQDSEAVHITAQLIKRLRAASHEKAAVYSISFKKLDEITHTLQTINKSALPEKLLSTAKKFSATLLKEKHSTILHGDLHHENILLSAKDGWLAIDPKGLIGDPAYEVATFICNPMPELMNRINIIALLKTRFSLFSALLGVDMQRLYKWAYVRAVLGACWQIEDKQDPKYFMKVAETLDIL